MGKSRTRGCRGLYLKGKWVVRVQDFILNLISSRIGDSFRFCWGFVLISLITPRFCSFALKSSPSTVWDLVSTGIGSAPHAVQRVSDVQHKAGRRAWAMAAMAGRHRAQAVAMATGPALALSWARDALAGWAASCAAWKQREGEWNGEAGRAGLSVQPGFGPLPNRS
jgi:hypothetical protein